MARVFVLANRIYTNSYQSRPVLTSACANAFLASISDTLAQCITLANKNKYQEPISAIKPESSSITAKSVQKIHEASVNNRGFDYIRTLRFSSYGFLVAPVVHTWFSFLDKRLPLPQIKISKNLMASQMSTVIKRVTVDQIAFAPFGLFLFFSIIGVLEGHDSNGIKQKFYEAYIPALKANYAIWPFVQFINFRFLPLRYRLPFVSSI
ncbi:17910_t:CDS:2, partial [Cetraspora pellucida]